MDKKHQGKAFSSGRPSSAEQQAQLAMLQQLGIPFDPSLMAAYGLPPGIDAQQLLNPMAANGYPFMNPAAMQFTGLGSLGGGQGSTGAAEWWNLAQNQALAASLGAGYFPGMLPGMSMAPPNLTQDTKSKSFDGSNTSKVKDFKKQFYDKISPRHDLMSSPSVSRLQQDRKYSRESMNSSYKDRPESHHSTSSPFRASVSKQNDSSANASSSWMDGINSQQQQKMNEQVFQAELMRQMEQQYLLQQLQQQDQLNSAMQLMGGNIPGTSSSKQGSSDADKMQQQMAMMMQQFIQHGGGSAHQGMSPAMSASLLSTPGALETMMAMSQMGNLNSIPGIGNLQTPKSHEDKMSPSISSSQRNSLLHRPYSPKNHKQSSSPALSSSSKRKEQLISPRITQQTDSNAENSTFPGIPPGLSPDNALLAMLYSQQLQYDELIKQQMETVNKMREDDAKSSFKEMHKSFKSHVKQELSRPSSHHSDFYSRSNLHSPADSTSSSRGKAHISPARSPHRQSREPERNQSYGSSSRHVSPSRKKTSPNDLLQGNMSETLKLFSALASNPNLTQQELTALLSFPGAADPTAPFSGMGPTQLSSTARLSDPLPSAGQMAPTELEKLNKNIADVARDMERQKLEEQMKHRFEAERYTKKRSGKDNHVSVVHPNSFKFTDVADDDASTLSRRLKVDGKRSSAENKLDSLSSLENGDVGSSDGDIRSESSIDKNCGPKAQNRWRLVEDDDEVMEPLKHGWKREVRFARISNQFRGEVLYIAPCGKKLRSHPDVLSYLDDSKITHLHKNHFSFGSRLRVGKFYEQKENEDGGRLWIELTEKELDQHIQNQVDDRQTSSPLPDSSDLTSNYSSSSKGDSKPSKKRREKEKERQKEQLRFLKEQEEFRQQEQQRFEREIRERLALEELERQRVAELFERDQRRQQMLLMRALESRKRAEERERRKEEIRIEKMMQREKKMEQRRIAMQIARELRMPVEDMATIGATKLPEITRLQGTYDNECQHQLSGNACGDLLMVLEFLKTFKKCIRLDSSLLPTFEKLQLGLLNDPMHTTGLVQITMTLLHQCLCDPGVPAPGPWLHCLTGVKVTDIDVGADNYSEILRLFIWARSGYKTEIALHLETLPFLSLTADEKATCLAFLVNELVCSRPICMEIEKNLDTLATLRKDKWMVEGQIRQLRIAYEKNPNVDFPILKMDEDENSSNSFSSRTDQIKEEQSEESLFQKKMEELTQQQNSFNTQLAHTSKPLRALDLGQDRYKRRYWVLPNLGGVYVEGLESGISYEDDDESPDEAEDESEDENKTQNPESMEVDRKEVPDHNPKKEAENNLKLERSNQNDVSEAIEVTDSGVKVDTDGQLKDEVIKCEFSSGILPGSVAEPSENETSHSENHAQSLSLLQDSSKENGATDTDTQLTSEKHNENSKPSQLDNLKSTRVNEDSTADPVPPLALLNSTHDSDGSVLISGLGDETVPSQIINVSTALNSVQVKSSQSEVVLVSKSSSTVGRTGDRSLKNEENDKVIAAAKAIAAKAVASSSHLLFPKGGSPSPTKSKPKKETEVLPGKHNDKKLSNMPESATGGLAISEHMINALVQMGINPTSLTSQQMEVLSHLGISASILTDFSNLGLISDSISKLDQKSENTLMKEHPLSQSSKPHTNEVQIQNTVQLRKKSEDQDTPMDLSHPVISQTPNQNDSDRPSTPSPVKSTPVKIESLQRDSPSTPVRESPDSKSIDSQFFVPISHSTTSDWKVEQQQYNQVVSSCPSPNTLANYIVSSVNYGNFPALDDIKFPIRAPDVKEEPDGIPRERKRGWWRIGSESDLRSLSEKLYLRGIREKQLHRNITKNFDICTNSMEVSALPEHQFAVLTKDSADKDESKSEEKLTDVQKIAKGGQDSSQERKFNVTSRFVSSENLAYEAEMQVLYRVEELSARSVNMGIVSPQWRNDNPKPSMMRKDLTHVPLGPLRDETGIEIKFDALNPIYHDPKSVLGAAVEFLGCLERAVCRSYLKPPLVRKGGSSEFSSLPSLSESGAMDVAAGLRTWRNAVASSASASQLALCIRMLESCIAWDRSANQSPTKLDVSPLPKTKKRKTEKKSTPKNLIATDSPQPKKRKKKRTSPHKNSTTLTKEGKKVKRMPIDTADVISKSGATPLTNGEICSDSVDNGTSSEIFNSFEDSLASAECSSEFAHSNGHEALDLGAASSTSPARFHANSDTGNVSEEYQSTSGPKKKKKKKKKMKLNSEDELPKKPRKPRKRADKDTVICRGVLRELQSHEDATWFLFPVDCKLVPGYRKIIQKPIDFHTIESRLKRGRYKSKEDFVSEVGLVFHNCRIFNEDDSNIGRAGQQIRNFFERRWAEVLRDKYGETALPTEPHPLLVNDVQSHTNQEPETSIQEPESEPLSESTSYQDSESGLVIDDS